MKTLRNASLIGLALGVFFVLLGLVVREVVAHAGPTDYDRWFVQKMAQDFSATAKVPTILTSVPDLASIDKDQLEKQSLGVVTGAAEFMLVRKERTLILWTYGNVGTGPKMPGKPFTKDLLRTQNLAAFGTMDPRPKTKSIFALGTRTDVVLPAKTDLSEESLPILRKFYEKYSIFFSMVTGKRPLDPNAEIENFRAYVILNDRIAYSEFLVQYAPPLGGFILGMNLAGLLISYKKFQRAFRFSRGTMSEEAHRALLQEFPIPGLGSFCLMKDPSALCLATTDYWRERAASVTATEERTRRSRAGHAELDQQIQTLRSEIPQSALTGVNLTASTTAEKRALLATLQAKKRALADAAEAPARKRRELEATLSEWVSRNVPLLPEAKRLLEESRALDLTNAKRMLSGAVAIQREAYRRHDALVTKARQAQREHHA